jgi:hypothetical protein
MNKIVEDQLAKVRVADLPPYDEDTLHLVIPKKAGPPRADLILNKCYLIQVEDYIVKPFEGFTLHDNWNNGIPPKHNILKIEVIQLMGKMVKVKSIGYDLMNKRDTLDLWEGWLPRKAIKILEIL